MQCLSLVELGVPIATFCFALVLTCLVAVYAWPELIVERLTFFDILVKVFSVLAVVFGAAFSYLTAEKQRLDQQRQFHEEEQSKRQTQTLQRQQDHAEETATTVIQTLKSFKVISKCLQLRPGSGPMDVTREAGLEPLDNGREFLSYVEYRHVFFADTEVENDDSILGCDIAGKHCHDAGRWLLERYFKQIFEQMYVVADMNERGLFGKEDSPAFLKLRLRLCVMAVNFEYHFFNNSFDERRKSKVRSLFPNGRYEPVKKLVEALTRSPSYPLSIDVDRIRK